MSALNIEMDEYLYSRVLEKTQRERHQQQQLDVITSTMKTIGIHERNNKTINNDKFSNHRANKSKHNNSSSPSSSSSPSTLVTDLSQSLLTEEQQLVLINERIITMQQLAIIYQNQYVARRNAKQIPALFTQIVESRLAHNLKRSFKLWVETLRNEQIVNMMCRSRATLTKRKVSLLTDDGNGLYLAFLYELKVFIPSLFMYSFMPSIW